LDQEQFYFNLHQSDSSSWVILGGIRSNRLCCSKESDRNENVLFSSPHEACQSLYNIINRQREMEGRRHGFISLFYYVLSACFFTSLSFHFLSLPQRVRGRHLSEIEFSLEDDNPESALYDN
jgi:hypothetical protein